MKIKLKTGSLLLFLYFFQSFAGFAQNKTPEENGFRFLKTLYKKDTVELVVVSKVGEETKPKPIILIEKGSLATPLVVVDDNGFYGIMPFSTKTFTDHYHLVFVSKPGVPAKVHRSKVSSRGEYTDLKTGEVPLYYWERNHLGYYVGRDTQVLKYLKKQPWVDKSKMVVAGHSEGGAIVAKLATVSKDVTHVISSCENPFGQMATIMAQIRADEDSAGTYAKEQFEFYEKLINEDKELPHPPGIPAEYFNRYLHSFNLPAYDNFRKIKVPVLITYGTKDDSAPFNDYMHIAMIREKKRILLLKTTLV